MNEYINLLNKDNKTEYLKRLYIEGINNNVPIIQDDSLWVVLAILKMKNAKKILEIGTAIGYSSLCFVSDDESRFVGSLV